MSRVTQLNMKDVKLWQIHEKQEVDGLIIFAVNHIHRVDLCHQVVLGGQHFFELFEEPYLLLGVPLLLNKLIIVILGVLIWIEFIFVPPWPFLEGWWVSGWLIWLQIDVILLYTHCLSFISIFLYVPSIFLQFPVIVANTQSKNLIPVAASLVAFSV